MENEEITFEQIPQKCLDVMEKMGIFERETSLISMFVMVWRGPVYLNVTFFDFPKSWKGFGKLWEKSKNVLLPHIFINEDMTMSGSEEQFLTLIIILDLV